MNGAQHSRIVNFIWGIADDVLRDLYVRGKYRDVILPMTVLRRLDAVLEPTKQAVLDIEAALDEAGITNKDAPLRDAAGQAFYNTSRFTLRDLRSRANQQQLRSDFEAYLDGFSPNVQEILDNFEFRNQIPRLSRADALGALIEKFLDPSINLSPKAVFHGDGSVRHPGLDNHAMGTIFEELIRRFNEENNEEAGEHWTPRDAVRLMANLIFLPVADQIESGTYLLYDGACGTGGMLTVAEETLQELASEHGKEVSTHLYGQEINAETYAICKADLLLKGEGEQADNIVGGPEYSTLSNDAFPSREFDFMLSNPPYGKSWKSDLERLGGKGGIKDPRFIIEHAGDPERDGAKVFDSIVVVTDRVILDQQIRDTIKQFAQVGSTVGHAEHSGDLKAFIQSGKKIIITTVQKFPVVYKEIGDDHRGNTFAIVVDEAHSSQGGQATARMSEALSAAGGPEGDEETIEDKINRIIEARKLLPNASYFAFTATPKNKTLETFGEEIVEDGRLKHRPFHTYTMKQAIQEGFILDVLKSYTPVQSYYRLIKTVEADPEFDVRRANKKLRRYVESHDHAIRLKAEIMVDHFHEQVLGLGKIGGQARAMVVTSGIERAIQYFHAISAYLRERKSPYRAIVAFSGEHEYHGINATEASLNGFPSSQIADKIREDPYRFLVVADKFQTGYDEPLLHTMYVDKVLSGIKAVQTLSRLNRAHPQKHDVFVLDFMNHADTIEAAFADYYRTTVLSEETDPDKLHDLKADLDDYEVYSSQQIDDLVELYLGNADRDRLDPILDGCVATYNEQLDEDEQVDFKGKAKAFTRTYSFLASILPYAKADREKLSIFLNFLIPKLPAPKEEDLSRGIIETIDMDSYRVEKKAAMRIALPDEDAEIGPVPTSGGGGKAEPELELLSNILRAFNDQFGNIEWVDKDRVHRLITQDIPARVSEDAAYQNARKNNDKQNARIEHDKAMARVMNAVLKDDTELFKLFSDNESFRRWLLDTVFAVTYGEPADERRAEASRR